MIQEKENKMNIQPLTTAQVVAVGRFIDCEACEGNGFDDVYPEVAICPLCSGSGRAIFYDAFDGDWLKGAF